MDVTSLVGLVEEHLAVAHAAHSGRSSHTLYGGHEHSLRQTVIALTAGQSLAAIEDSVVLLTVVSPRA